MSNNSLGSAPSISSMSSLGAGVMYSNTPLPSPQLGGAQGSPAQHSPAPTAAKLNQGADTGAQLLSRPRIQELIREVDPTIQIDEEVEEMLLQLADDFIDSTLNAACAVAKHRHAASVELKDVQLHLERQWNMWIPGFGTEELRPYKRSTVTEAHRQRMALLRKAVKKY